MSKIHCCHFDAGHAADYNLLRECEGKARGPSGEDEGSRSVTPTLASGSASELLTRDGRGLSWLSGLRIARREALPSVIGDRAIDDRAAIDAFPCIEDQKEIGEPLEHHEPFALRTFHRFLPGCDVHSWGVPKQEPNQFLSIRNFNILSVRSCYQGVVRGSVASTKTFKVSYFCSRRASGEKDRRARHHPMAGN